MTKKIIGVLLAILLVVPGMSMDALGAPRSVQLLEDLGIIEPEVSTGLFNPDYLRDKFAKTLVMMFLDTESGFSQEDLASDISGSEYRWYINYAIMSGLMTTDESGNFHPSGYVTKIDAVRGILNVTGHSANAEKRGGSDLDYMLEAGLAGLLNGLKIANEQRLTRDEVAKLVSNAMKITPLTQDYERTSSAKPTLYQLKKLEKLRGRIFANQNVGLASDKSKKGYINIDGEEFLSDILVNDELVGSNVTYYTREIEGEKSVVSIIVDKETAPVTIEARDINRVSFDVNYVIVHYGDDENIRLDYKSYFIVNNKNMSVSRELFDNFKSGHTTMLDSDQNGVYDVAHMTLLKTEIVDGISHEKHRIVTKYNDEKIELEHVDDSIRVYLNNQSADFSQIRAGHVINIACDAFSFEDGWLVFDYAAASSVKIYVSTRKVAGTVSETSNYNGTIVLNDLSYSTGEFYSRLLSQEKKAELKPGDSIVALFDNYRVMVDYLSEAHSDEIRYGYIIKSAISKKMFENTLQIKLLTDEGNIVIYDVAEKFTLDGDTGVKSNSETDGVVDLNRRQVIRYRVSEGLIREIDTATVNTPHETSETSLTLDLKREKRFYAGSTFKQRAALTANTVIFRDGAADIENPDDKAFEVITTTSISGNYYTIEGYDLSDMNEMSCAVLYEEAASALETNIISYMVGDISQAINEEREQGVNLIVYGNGRETNGFFNSGNSKLLLMTASANGADLIATEADPSDAINLLKKGDLIRFRQNNQGEFTYIERLFSFDKNTEIMPYKENQPRWNIIYGNLYNSNGTFLNFNFLSEDRLNETTASDAYLVRPGSRQPSIPVYDVERDIVKLEGAFSALPSYKSGDSARVWVRFEYQSLYDVFVYLLD
ncbi:MAG: S-layer homology domain-containing protein [Clostridiaceae bacterium]|nr:S-layer homology domain-containing protein [Clostridiaceae bacterium]